MKSWMKKLALHYESIRSLYPHDQLMVLFDIDGTILDMRYMIFHVLKGSDRHLGFNFFKDLSVSDILVHENQIEDLLVQMEIPDAQAKQILDWYINNRWTSSAILESHRPFSGVMEVMRWFQIQPNTHVGLNTGRPEIIREATLRSLNELGKEYKVSFTDDLLHMNPLGWNEETEKAKTDGMRHYQTAGFRIFAVVDNEPSNLTAASKSDPNQEILLLHANTIFESKRRRLPNGSARGKVYDLTELVNENSLPQHIQFVWHGVNDEANLRQFISSDVTWGELDLRMDCSKENVILHHDPLDDDTMDYGDNDYLHLHEVLGAVKESGKSIKLDMKENGILVDRILETLPHQGFDDSRLWFNGNVHVLKQDGFRKLSQTFPSATIQCPIDFMAPLILSVPDKAKELLDIFADWGINRFSLRWDTPNKMHLLDQISSWGYEVNIYDVRDFESFLKAVLLLPKSITSDFNFPKWHYYGRGSGANGSHHEYAIRRGVHQTA